MSLETMTEAMVRLQRAGYAASFSAENGGIRCSTCDSWHEVDEVSIDEVVRFEGESDPADEAVLFALTCAGCRAKGTLVAAYGPDMDADTADVIRRLGD